MEDAASMTDVLTTLVSWPATTQLTSLGFGVKLVSKAADWAGSAGFIGF
jgi:hypothetical protein